MTDTLSDYPREYTNSHAWMSRAGRQDPLIITCALNGGFQGKEAHPRIPETPDEIAEEAYEAYRAGAAVLHIHARDPQRLWDCTGDPRVFAEINTAVRACCPDVILNNSTGGGLRTTHEDRLRQLDAAPDMASLNLGPWMERGHMPPRPDPLPHAHDGFDYDSCGGPTYGEVEQLAGLMQERGIKPELELYHHGQFWVSDALIEHDLVAQPLLFQFIMGYQTSVRPTPWHLIDLIRELPRHAIFSVVGLGKYQLPMAATSITMGGHVRVGLEDNLYAKRGQLWKSNAEAVRSIVRLAEAMNRPVATPAQARQMLGVPPASDPS